MVDKPLPILTARGRLYGVIVSNVRIRQIYEFQFGGTIDPTDLLPVRFRLPDGENWLVATYGSTIGTPSGTARDVAVVPLGSTVTVTPSGGQPHSIRLAA